MVKIIVRADCGNSPKNLMLRDFNIAAAKGDLKFVERSLTEDAVWRLYEPSGQKEIHGRANVLREYRENLVIAPAEFEILNVLSHGSAGAVNGAIKAKGGKRYVFCDIYKFASHAKGAKIKEMTSYIIRKR